MQNPKRVYIGTPAAYGNDKEGVTTLNMVKNDNALYGINGGGFYDKFRAAEPGHPTLALCYEFQMLDHLETEEFDIPVDAVLWA